MLGFDLCKYLGLYVVLDRRGDFPVLYKNQHPRIIWRPTIIYKNPLPNTGFELVCISFCMPKILLHGKIGADTYHIPSFSNRLSDIWQGVNEIEFAWYVVHSWTCNGLLNHWHCLMTRQSGVFLEIEVEHCGSIEVIPVSAGSRCF